MNNSLDLKFGGEPDILKADSTSKVHNKWSEVKKAHQNDISESSSSVYDESLAAGRFKHLVA